MDVTNDVDDDVWWFGENLVGVIEKSMEKYVDIGFPCMSSHMM